MYMNLKICLFCCGDLFFYDNCIFIYILKKKNYVFNFLVKYILVFFNYVLFYVFFIIC